MTQTRYVKKTHIMAAILALAVALSCTSAPERPVTVKTGDYSHTIEYLKWLIAKEMSHNGIKGMSIALVDDQTVVWADGFGFAVKSKGFTATRDTLYQIGSISKIFTAMAAMKLAEEGKLNIEKPVSHYLKGFTYKKRFQGPEPTVRHLMYHHAGLPSDNFSIFFTKTKTIPFTNMAATLAGEYAAYPPDHVFSYCNLCVTLEGHVIQNVAGEDFISYTERTLFNPMVMKHTSFSSIPKDQSLMSRGYMKGAETDHYIVNPIPAGSIISNVMDLAEFIKTVNAGGMHGGSRVLKSETLARMFQAQNAQVPLDLDMRFGLGWFLSGLEFIAGTRLNYSGTVAWHGGSTVLFNTALVVLPELKLGVVVLTNTNTGDRASAKIAVEALNRAIEAKTGKPAPVHEIKEPARIVMDPGELDAYAGHYATEYLGVVRITASGKRASIKIAGIPLTMTFTEGKKFSLSFLGLKPGMLKDKYFSIEEVAGRKLLVVHVYGKKYLAGVKVDAVPVSDAWRKRTGAYVSVDSGDAVPLYEGVELRYRDGFLLVYYKIRGIPLMVPSLILQPVSDTEAVIAGLGRNMGQTLRVETVDGKEMIYYSGSVLRKNK